MHCILEISEPVFVKKGSLVLAHTLVVQRRQRFIGIELDSDKKIVQRYMLALVCHTRTFSPYARVNHVSDYDTIFRSF